MTCMLLNFPIHFCDKCKQIGALPHLATLRGSAKICHFIINGNVLQEIFMIHVNNYPVSINSNINKFLFNILAGLQHF